MNKRYTSEKERENDILKELEEKIKKNSLVSSSGRVVHFERDYDYKDMVWEDSGNFYMYQIENGKALMSTKTEIIDFVWNDNVNTDKNIRDANEIADNYTVAFNMGDEESRGMFKNDLYYIADWGS